MVVIWLKYHLNTYHNLLIKDTHIFAVDYRVSIGNLDSNHCMYIP